jgi:hypothetical protein
LYLGPISITPNFEAYFVNILRETKNTQLPLKDKDDQDFEPLKQFYRGFSSASKPETP